MNDDRLGPQEWPEPPPATPGPVSPWSRAGAAGSVWSSSSAAPPLTPAPVAHRRRASGAVVAVVAAALLGGSAGALIQTRWSDGGRTVVAPPAATPGNNDVANRGSGGVTEHAAAAVLPSIVTISVTLPDGSGDLGSGVVLSSDGDIMTNDHVVSAAANGQARMSVTFHDGTTTSARIVGTDKVTDLAVIRAAGVRHARPATLGRSAELAVGQPVLAIGSPLSQDLSGTVTSGVVSAINRPVNTSEGQQDPNQGGGQAAQPTVIDAIQTDAAINPGNSGGALVDSGGRIVGINQSIDPGDNSSGQPGNIGIGFAIPIDEARPIVKELLGGQKPAHAQLGVAVTDAASPGAQLSQVNGKAARIAGLEKGDVITHVGNRLIDSGDGLIAAIRAHRPGDTVTVTYTRGGTQHTTKIALTSDATD